MLKRMTGSRISPFALCLVAASFSIAAHAQPGPPSPLSISISPKYAVSGSPELIRVEGVPATGAEGEWLGHKLLFFRGSNGHSWLALAGIDVEAPPGASELVIHLQGCREFCDASKAIEIHAAHYRVGRLSVAPKFIEPSPEELKEIQADKEIKEKVFATSAPEALWHADFHAPVHSPPTDSFGTRRMFNGKLASIHKGMDFRAPSGTVVRASNSGVVVLARHLYFEGNCVVIDHGLGLYTLSMHFSRIDVHEGDHVKAGDRLGLSGATGRVTGPHLHWAVRWENAYLDPAKVLRLNLNNIH